MTSPPDLHQQLARTLITAMKTAAAPARLISVSTGSMGPDGPLTDHVRASDRFAMKPISRADVAWHILNLAENPASGRSRTPVLATGASRKSRPAGTGNLPARQAPTVR
jgi:hypothetical protein